MCALNYSESYVYNKVHGKEGPLVSRGDALYEELQYLNYTGCVLVVITSSGARTVIPPAHKGSIISSDRRCIIKMRSILGPQLVANSAVDCNVVDCDLRIWNISANELNSNPVYVKELNVIICFDHQADYVEHPFRKLNSHDRADEYCKAIIQEFENENVWHFIVNDPLKKLDNIYAEFDGKAIELALKHDVDYNTDKITLTAFVKGKDGIVKQTYDIDAILKEEYISLPSCPLRLLGLTRGLIERHRGEACYSQKELDDEIKRAKLTAQKEQQQTIDDLKTKCSSIESERDRLKTKNEELKEQLNTITGSLKGSQTVEEFRTSRDKTQSDHTKSVLDTIGSAIKVVGVLASTVASIVVIVDKFKK